MNCSSLSHTSDSYPGFFIYMGLTDMAAKSKEYDALAGSRGQRTEGGDREGREVGDQRSGKTGGQRSGRAATHRKRVLPVKGNHQGGDTQKDRSLASCGT
jgi:hypothetical protein